MTENEKWIDDLRNQITYDDDKILFDETSGCFLTKHYRAAYILSWITIIESLKRRIKLFSNLGDSRATDAVKEIEEAEDKKLSTDRLIFNESKKCGIIDNADFSTINYLWEQRCLFAHPYNKQPEIDEVKHIIGQSIKLVLGRQLLYNKGFLTDLSENIATKPFFLPNEVERVREFAARTIARTNTDLHPFFFKTLLYKVGQIIEVPEKFNELRKLRWYLIELFVNTDLDLSDNRWSLENKVTKFPYECAIGFVHQDIWEKLPMRIKEMLISYVVSENDTKRLISLKSIVRNLIESNKLEEDLKTNYYSKLEKLDFNSAINFYGSNESKYYRIITELESWQYEQQNPVIDHLKTEGATEFLNSLDIDKQFYLGRLLRACASGGHWKTQYLLSDIINGSITAPDNLKAGIAVSSFIDRQDKYSLDRKFVVRAVK
ncbi:MAG: hypothetical protein MK105_18800, partial [Crocinitomicaceae bacterium]|nr:hypothetical protein [Crocinitomicaceae bacterium]